MPRRSHPSLPNEALQRFHPASIFEYLEVGDQFTFPGSDMLHVKHTTRTYMKSGDRRRFTIGYLKTMVYPVPRKEK